MSYTYLRSYSAFGKNVGFLHELSVFDFFKSNKQRKRNVLFKSAFIYLRIQQAVLLCKRGINTVKLCPLLLYSFIRISGKLHIKQFSYAFIYCGHTLYTLKLFSLK